MASDHYFSSQPASATGLRRIDVSLVGETRHLWSASGVFSPGRIDTGTRVLLQHLPPPPVDGHLLDLGCGWGPIALTLGIRSPQSTIWAVDVNERALDLVQRNAAELSLSNINAARPEDVPADITFGMIASNPPIRVGKRELHDMLLRWLPRLRPNSDAWLVVQRNLGSDSLHRWLQSELSEQFQTKRAATAKGYRVLRVRRGGDHDASTSPSAEHAGSA